MISRRGFFGFFSAGIVALAISTRLGETKLEETVGYTGQTEIDSGFFYCPFIPLQS